MPKRIDPNYREVNVKVYLNESLFVFNNEDMTIRQKRPANKVNNQTINITLSNELNLTANYSMFVQFICIKIEKTETKPTNDWLDDLMQRVRK